MSTNYSSEPTDTKWMYVWRYLTRCSNKADRALPSLRHILNAIFYVLRRATPGAICHATSRRSRRSATVG